MSIITEIFNNLHFIRPMVLWSLPIVLFIVWFLQRNESKDDGWSKICDPHLLQAIKIKSSAKGSNWSWLLWPIAIISVIAIAGPAYKKEPSPVIKNQSALIIALDVSRSMLADDIKPNRLERAKFKINDILEARKDGQTALVVYAGDAFVVTPLTDDTETIALMLKAITPDIMPVQGSRVDIALKKSQELLVQAGYPNGEVILLSDGVNSDRAETVAEELASNNINTSVLAIGTKDGAPIPSSRGFVKDKAGNIVIPKLEISALKALSSSGNGRFAQITGDTSDINFLMPTVVGDEGEAEQENKPEDDAFNSEKYIDEGPWLALLLIPLMLLLFRKGVLLSLFLVVGLQTPQQSYAFDWDDLWMNSDQQAAQYIKNDQAQTAYDVAKSDQWKATAAFRNEDYTAAQNLFNDGTANGLYNQGNALAASGKLQEALDAYKKSLELRPDDEDTLYNKKKVEEALEQQQQQEQEQQDQENQDQDQQDQENQEQQDQQESGEQEQQEQQDQEGEQQEGEQNQDQSDNPENQEQNQDQAEMTEEEKQEEERKQKELEEKDKAEEEKLQQEPEEVQLTPEELAENAENKEAIEQWLRRIPDDPGGLLRRKFYYQYNQQNTKPDETDDW
ncbi:MAG: VWA domain-containing protein [Marinicellaceae bacterium]